MALMEQTERNRIQEASKLESLRNLTERYDGYGNAIRKVMERKNDTPGIVGVVADIIKVDSKYETAMETALGGSIQNIVTKDEATAKKIVDKLGNDTINDSTIDVDVDDKRREREVGQQEIFSLVMNSGIRYNKEK